MFPSGRLYTGETDGSSFPNGGLRATHTAAAFTSWDRSSPCFVYDKVLRIPCAFVTHYGRAIDDKTPLLRSQDAVAREGLRLLKACGVEKEASTMYAYLGWEQEFFVVSAELYKKRPDLVNAGRTLFGGLLFSDAAINLHDVRELDDGRLQTRWTLRVCFSALPWAPTARFTGISVYDLDAENKIKGQTDYWDSIDLNQGSYARSSKGDAVQDFVNQLLGGSKTSEGELPYELLRRADYSVRRYPAVSVAEVSYDVRPEGYDMLGSYTGGFNEKDAKMTPFLPSIITVPRSGGGAKTMTWPVSLAEDDLPGSRVVKTRRARELTVACLVFPQAATEDAVQCRAARQSSFKSSARWRGGAA